MFTVLLFYVLRHRDYDCDDFDSDFGELNLNEFIGNTERKPIEY